MVDKVVEIAQWMLLIKERVVLLLMLSVLCYRLFGVVNPPKPAEIKDYGPTAPVFTLSLEASPPMPPPRPPSDRNGSYSELTNRNPFLYQRQATPTEAE